MGAIDAPRRSNAMVFPITSNKRLLTGHQFTTNVTSIRGILWRWKALKSVFDRGSAPNPAEGAQDAPRLPVVGGRGETPLLHPTFAPRRAFWIHPWTTCIKSIRVWCDVSIIKLRFSIYYHRRVGRGYVLLVFVYLLVTSRKNYSIDRIFIKMLSQMCH